MTADDTPPPLAEQPGRFCAEHCAVPSVADHLAELLATLPHLGGGAAALAPSDAAATDHRRPAGADA
jgi:hypothetical protein